jgi:outer membrane protein OmpA-like peptidoglycan-associated protein
MRLTILTFPLIFLCLSAHSQWRSSLAERRFRLQHYSDALDLYSSLLKTKKPTSQIEIWTNWTRKFGRCAWESHQTIKAIWAMEQLALLEQRNEEDYVLQIKALTWNAKYLEAENLAKEAAIRYPTNHFFKNLSDLKLKLDKVEKHQWSYLLTPATFNTGKGEMTSYLNGNYLIYCSRKERTRTFNPLYPRDHGFYYHVRELSVNNHDEENELIIDKRGHCGPLTENSKGTMRILTRNFESKLQGNPNVPIGLFFMHLINGNWVETGAFPFNGDLYNTGQACFGANDTMIVFTSNRPGGFGGTDLYYSINRSGKWLEPLNLGKTVNTAQDECFPFIQGDSLFFSSNGHCGFGGLDIYETSLNKLDTLFNLGNQINSTSDDFGILGNKEMTKGFITSNRTGTIDRIYSFERKEPSIHLLITLDGALPVIETANYSATINNHPFTFEQNQQDEITALLSLRTESEEFISCSFDGCDPLQSLTISTEGIRKDTTIYARFNLTASKRNLHVIGIDKLTHEAIDSLNISLDNGDFSPIPKVEIVSDTSKSSIYITSRGFLDVDTLINWEHHQRHDTLYIQMTPIKKGVVFQLEDIYYDFNKASLRPESKETLDRLYQLLNRENLQIELGSHTDTRGSSDYNLKLSKDRALACYYYLIGLGIPSKSILPVGYGELQPKISCDNSDCPETIHQMNRRTEIRILGTLSYD